MPEQPYGDYYQSTYSGPPSNKKKEKPLLHLGLFIITFITTTIAGVQWTSASGGPYELSELVNRFTIFNFYITYNNFSRVWTLLCSIVS